MSVNPGDVVRIGLDFWLVRFRDIERRDTYWVVACDEHGIPDDPHALPVCVSRAVIEEAA
jgi:hypothetical protein